MPRGVPCAAFRAASGKLARTRRDVAVLERRHRMGRAALRDEVARTAFTLATLRGHAEFELDFVEAHPGARLACDFAIGDSAADTDDHGKRAGFGGLLSLRRV